MLVRISLFVLLVMLCQSAFGQTIIHTEKGGYLNELISNTPLSENSRQELRNIIATQNDPEVVLDEEIGQKSQGLYDIPVQRSNESFVQNKDYYYAVSAFFDHSNSPDYLTDFSCGYQTYNKHRGTDYFAFPFYWYQYQNELLDVVAVEDGILEAKVDSHDDSCVPFNGNEGDDLGNWIMINHGLEKTLYLHLKHGTLLSDTLKSFVRKGTVLGKVGYSGNALKPHLHFETYKDWLNEDFYDPYYPASDDCDPANCHFRMERNGFDEYKRTAVLSVTTHSQEPEWKTDCDDNVTEEPHFANCFNKGDTATIIVAVRDMLGNHELITTFRNPSSGIVNQWTYSLSDILDYNSEHEIAVYFKMKHVFDSDAPLGDWELISSIIDINTNSRVGEFVINENVCVHTASNSDEVVSNNASFRFYPQPASKKLYVDLVHNSQINSSEFNFEIKDISGVTRIAINSSELHSQGYIDTSVLQSGVYFIKYFNQADQSIGCKKIIIQ